MRSTRVNVLAAQAWCCLVEDFLIRPLVLEDVFNIVRRLVASWNKMWKDALIGLKVAIVEGAIRVSGEVDDDKGQVSRRVEDINVHESTREEVGSGGRSLHAAIPGISIPVRELDEESVEY